ncbi:MAG: radical SAM protein [Nitrospirae bacterium YQR-1]
MHKSNGLKIMLTNPAVKEKIDDKKERYFIKAGSRWPWSYIKRINEECVPPFPFYLAYSAQILRNEGFDVYTLDGVALNMEKPVFIEKVLTVAPDVLVIETAAHAFMHDVNLAKELKSKLSSNLKIIFTGPHATTFANEIMLNYPHIDIVLRGEYEFLLLEVVKRLQNNDNLRIDGVAYRDNGNLVVSGKKGFIEDINKLPYPAFELFPSEEAPDITRYGDGICTYKPAVTLHSSRGCPFKCNFCLWNQVMYDNRKYRMFSPERVVDEMCYVIENFGAKEIYFDDDDFCINKKHVVDICDEIKARKLKIKWSCMGDAISTDEEMLKVMAEAGCIFMKFGVESGNKDILRQMGKPLEPLKAIQTAEICRKYGIMTHATFVFGLYGDTMDSMRETLALANKIKFDYAQASIATPLPGTRLYDLLIDSGRIKDMDFNNFDGTRSCVVLSEHLSPQQVVAFRKKAIKSMVLHKMADPIWWRNFIRRNAILYKEYGHEKVFSPIYTLFNL